MARGNKPRAAESIYSVHPGVRMVKKWVEDLEANSGRTLEEWRKTIVEEGPKAHKERVAWVKAKAKVGGNTASWLAEYASGEPTWDANEESYLVIAAKYVNEMFAGPKAALLPLYRRLLEIGRGLGPDVKFCPCKTIVPFYRKHVFAQVKPTTRTRIDLGLALGDAKAEGRLIDTGGFQKKDRITHRIAISAADDIDDEIGKWLRVAYERDA